MLDGENGEGISYSESEGKAEQGEGWARIKET